MAIKPRHHYTQSRLTTAIAVATCTIYTHYNIRPNYFRAILIRSEKISQVTSASTSNTPMLFYSCRPTILHRQFPRYSLSDWKSAEHRNYRPSYSLQAAILKRFLQILTTTMPELTPYNVFNGTTGYRIHLQDTCRMAAPEYRYGLEIQQTSIQRQAHLFCPFSFQFSLNSI